MSEAETRKKIAELESQINAHKQAIQEHYQAISALDVKIESLQRQRGELQTSLAPSKDYADYYDAILTGDLGVLGSEILIDLCQKQGFDLSKVHFDAGKMIYDIDAQDAHCGGSGCGCVASVFTSYFFNKLKAHEMNKILVVATGALMSTTSSMQGDSIPGIAHAIAIENEV